MALSTTRALPWINVALFQAGWFGIVLSAAAGAHWIAPLATGAIVLWHLYHARQPRRELALVGIAVALGLVLESIMAGLQIVAQASGSLVSGAPAAWLLCLWAVFATTLNVSLRWLRSRPLLAAGLGAIGGPIAYAGGAGLGALNLETSPLSIGALGIGWALAMPLLLVAAARFDGYGSR
jgi:hypothetical protein